jgi:type I restriction enzyme S subunit
MNNQLRMTKLGEVLTPVTRWEAVNAAKEYHLLGIRLDGHGPFLRETLLGTQTSASKLFRVAKGDFIYSRLFACRGAFGVINDELDGCYVSGEFPTFVPVPGKVDVEFLKYWFHLPSVIACVDEKCTGSTPLTRNRFKENFFVALEVPLPPLGEQRRIVARIKELATLIHEARDLRSQAAKESQELRMLAMAHVMDAPEQAYPIRPLSELVAIRGGGTPSKSNPAYWEGSIPWITPKDMKRRELSDAIDHISELATRETAAKMIDPGSVLVVVRGMILAHTFPAAILRAPAAINQDMKALIPTDKLLPEFLCAAFWAYNRKFVGLVEKSTHDTRKLETDKLMGSTIAVPPLSEQRRIVAELDALESEAQSLKHAQTEVAVELDALFPSVISKAFAGEL